MDELLSTKWHAPKGGAAWVPRPHLFARLDEGRERKLTLVSAPAGFGKTTLINQWATHSQTPVAWLSLDVEDNDPARFMAYLAAALQAAAPEVGAAGLTHLSSALHRPANRTMAALINDHVSRARPISLVLDDYHLIDSQSVHEAVTYLLDHQPPQLHLIIATRADPPLPVARLRGSGQMVELRMNDLRFSPDETGAFLLRQGLDLSSTEVAMLDSRTEGWAVGIQLAAISLREHEDVMGFVQEFSASNRHILDYLVEEVLQSQPPATNTFLHETSILERLTAPLCDAVTGRDDSQTLLAAIEQANLFIIPLDDRRQWYRYHPLFSDLLLQRLQKNQADRVPALHGRAHQWYESAGLIGPAIQHALAAGDFVKAVHLVEQGADTVLLRGELRTFLNWLEALPRDSLRAYPRLRIYHAAALLTGGQSREAVETLLKEIQEGDIARALAGEINTVRALVAVFQGDSLRAKELARDALSLLSEDSLYLRGLVFIGIGIAELLADERAAALRIYDQLIALGEKSGNPLFTVTALCWTGQIHQNRGHLRKAYSLYTQALEEAVDEKGTQLPLAGMALAGLGEVWREWGEIDRAIRYLQESIELGALSGEIFMTMSARLSLARIWQALGDTNRADRAIKEARRLAQKTDTTEIDMCSVSLYQARLWLRQQNLDGVRQWTKTQGVDLQETLLKGETSSELQNLHRSTYGLVVKARLHISEGKPIEALQLLEAVQAKLEAGEFLGLKIEIHVLKALAYQESGDLSQALAALDKALSLAQPEAYVRIFVDEGAPMARLLYRAATQSKLPDYVGRLLAAFPTKEDKESQSSAADGGLVEPFSEREIEVLHLIKEGLSNQEIAARLFISLSTVKGHTSHIYSKLHVSSRTAAVARAATLGIFPEM